MKASLAERDIHLPGICVIRVEMFKANSVGGEKP